MDVSTEVIERWADLMGPAIAGAANPPGQAAAIDHALSLDGNPSQRLGMWLALLRSDDVREKHEALAGIAHVLAEVSSIRTSTATMLFEQLSEDDLWLQPYAVERCLSTMWRIGELNPETRREVVSYALLLLTRYGTRHEAFDVIARFAAPDHRTLERIGTELPTLCSESRLTLLNLLEARIRAEAPHMFVSYVETLMQWWHAFDALEQEDLLERLTPILNSEILQDFTCISAHAFERAANAIAHADGLSEELRRSLIRELVPHSLDLAARQPLAPPLQARLEQGRPDVIDQVMVNSEALDPLAAAGFLLNIVRSLRSSPLRFTLAERLIAAYGDWDIVRRAATIDVLGREMWRHLGHSASTHEVEGLAEASEPFIDAMEVELVEQLRGEIDTLRLLSFPRI